MSYSFSKADCERIAAAVKKYERQGADLSPMRRSRHVAAPSTAYNGVFAVIKTTDTSVTICSLNVAAGRPVAAQLFLGLNVLTFTEVTLAVSASSYIYLQISYSSSSYTVTASAAAMLPTQINTTLYYPLAYVITESGKISKIQQLQYGHIHGADGRIV